MHEITGMPDLVVRYFSSTPWLAAFIISMVHLFIRLNTAKKRAMLTACIIFLLFANAVVIKIFTILGQNATYYRHLWAIPTIAIIGIALVDLIRILPTWYFRIPVVIVLTIGLWFINENEYIRCREQIFSRDTKLVPEDVIELGDRLEEIRKESGRNTIFVVCPIGYERPNGNMVTELNLYGGCLKVIDSSILTDDNHNGETELMDENPDVDYVISTCCSKGIDYVVVSKIGKEKYDLNEYEPEVITDSFLLYKCAGYDGYTQDMTTHDLISWKEWHDEAGFPGINESGIHKVVYEYDEKDRMILEENRDIDGNLVTSADGFARRIWKYGRYGLEEHCLYDAEGNPSILTNYGYSIIRYKRNEKGQVVELCYYNEKDELIDYDFRNPRATTRFVYDDKGNLISEKYYDTEDNPSKALAGYDEIRREYDDYHHMTSQCYYADDALIDRSDTGYAVEKYIYSMSWRVIDIKYYDHNGNEVEPPY